MAKKLTDKKITKNIKKLEKCRDEWLKFKPEQIVVILIELQKSRKIIAENLWPADRQEELAKLIADNKKLKNSANSALSWQLMRLDENLKCYSSPDETLTFSLLFGNYKLIVIQEEFENIWILTFASKKSTFDNGVFNNSEKSITEFISFIKNKINA